MGKRRSLEQVEGLWDDESQSYILPDVNIKAKVPIKNKIKNSIKNISANTFRGLSHILGNKVLSGIYYSANESARDDGGIFEFIRNIPANTKAYDGRIQMFENVDPANAFLFPKKRQKQYLEKIGYTLDNSNDYGLVEKAVNNYKNITGREVPIYKFGNDDISRDSIIPLRHNILQNRSTFENIKYVPGSGNFEYRSDIGDVTDYPLRFYRDKNGTLYVKKWDFLDHGDYSHDKLNKDSDLYITKSLTDYIRKYGNYFDKLGNPFVRTTGYQKVEDFSLKDAYKILDPSINIDSIDTSNFRNRILSKEFDIKYKKGGRISLETI